ncbi:Uncharacterised protein [Mycobacterium tuberculosis]|uniref:Uncharacterized protein n=1 Tax=Mycobacterium tuberculosis TaxID=1773 RepID=A0A655JKR0_MYCTX|nr:Uncharacterised protein [Mycobacterium tuberculosis]
MTSLPASTHRRASSWWASRSRRTINGWATAVSVISSVEAVVPSRARSRSAAFDHAAIWSAAPGS